MLASRTVNELRLPISGGIVPVRWFPKRVKAERFLKFQIIRGIEPESQFAERSSSINIPRLPISEGMEPVKLLLLGERY